MFKRIVYVLLLLMSMNITALPRGFVYLSDIDHSIIQEIKYATHDNFVGRPIRGYERGCCILTKEAALALSKVQQSLPKGLSLKVYDGYRPQRAVNDFIAWRDNLNDQTMKQRYYPNLKKQDLFGRYIAEKSAHSRGSTVDLTLVDISSAVPIEINMGTHYDYLDNASHSFNMSLPGDVRIHRLFLQEIMQRQGFHCISTEWWHFTLENEPFKQTYFEFPVQ